MNAKQCVLKGDHLILDRSMQLLRHVMYQGSHLGEEHKSGFTLSGSDLLRSRVIGKASGKAMEQSAYDPYGNIGELSSNIGYTGQRRESLLGGYCLGNGKRVYQPRIMRFMTPDSYSPFNEGGINPYMYCLGDPVNKTDPSGHQASTMMTGFNLAIVILECIILAATIYAAPAFTWTLAILVTLDVSSLATFAAGWAVKDPQTSADLMWASMGLGLASVVFSSITMLRIDLQLSRAELGVGFSRLYRNSTIERRAEALARARRGGEFMHEPAPVRRRSAPPAYDEAYPNGPPESYLRARAQRPVGEALTPSPARDSVMESLEAPPSYNEIHLAHILESSQMEMSTITRPAESVQRTRVEVSQRVRVARRHSLPNVHDFAGGSSQMTGRDVSLVGRMRNTNIQTTEL